MLVVFHFFNKDYNPSKLPVIKKHVFSVQDGKRVIEELKGKCTALFGKAIIVEEI